jgi:hypothetical protein
MTFRHVRPHDQHAVAMLQVHRGVGGAPSSIRSAQTGHG